MTLIIVLLVILIAVGFVQVGLISVANKPVANKPVANKPVSDQLNSIAQYCSAYENQNYRQADEMKADTIDAILKLIKLKQINPDKLKPGNHDSAISHNCTYLYKHLNLPMVQYT